MSAHINLKAFGNLAGSPLPFEAFNEAIDQAKSTGRALAEQAYKDASSAISKGTAAASQYATQAHTITKPLLQLPKQIPLLKTNLLAAKSAVQQQVQDFGYEMGAAAATGAQETVTDTLKRWAPWAIGGVAVAGLGIWLLRR